MVKMSNSLVSGRLRKPGQPGTRVSDFTASFTEKIKSNNDTLAKSLAKVKLKLEHKDAELREEKSKNGELMVLMSLDRKRSMEMVERLEGCVRRCTTQVKTIVDDLMEIRTELYSFKTMESSRRRPHTDASMTRVGNIMQTQSVGPMVQGHSIQQPLICLSRINPRMQNGNGMAATPPPMESGSASPNRTGTPVASASALEKTSKPNSVTDNQIPDETQDMLQANIMQTQSVGPIVQGHRIQQPHIYLSRINPHMQNGCTIPATPPLVEPGSASPNCAGTPVSSAGASALEKTSRTNTVEGKHIPHETQGMFIARLHSEDPMEGSSSGISRRWFKPPDPVNEQSSDDDDDFVMSPASNRTSYSPAEMDITLKNQRLSTIFQEPSPLERRSSLYQSPKKTELLSDVNVPSADRSNTKKICLSPEIEYLSPIPQDNFQVSGSDSSDTTPVIRNKKTKKPTKSGGNDRPKVRKSPLTPEVFDVQKSESVKRTNGKTIDKHTSKPVSQSGSSEPQNTKSAPSCLTNRATLKRDPEWRPKSESSKISVRGPKKSLRKRRVIASGTYAEDSFSKDDSSRVLLDRMNPSAILSGRPASKDFKDLFMNDIRLKRTSPATSDTPRVLLDRLDPSMIEEARQDCRSRASERMVAGNDEQGRSLRRVAPASYKEPSLNVKMRRT